MSAASVGNEIRRRREAQGLKLVVLAERAKVHPSHLRRVERGEVDLSMNVLGKIATALGIPCGLLLGPAPKLSARAIEAGRLFELADRETQEAVLGVIRAMTNPRDRRGR